MKSNHLILLISILIISCNGNKTLDKNAQVYREMSFYDFYGVQTSQKSMDELHGKIVQMKGYFGVEVPYKTGNNQIEHGNFKASFGPGPGAQGFAVECFFNEQIKLPGYYKETTIKGEVVSKGMLKLKNCVVVE